MIGDVYVGTVGSYLGPVRLCNIDKLSRAVSEVFGCISARASDGRNSGLRDNTVRENRGTKRRVQKEYERGQVERSRRTQVGRSISPAKGLSDGSVHQTLVVRHGPEGPFPDTSSRASVEIGKRVNDHCAIQTYRYARLVATLRGKNQIGER